MEASVKFLRAIQVAFLVSIVLYVGVGERTGILRHFVDPTMFYVLSMVTVIIVGVILVGRTSFWDPLVNGEPIRSGDKKPVNKIAGRYREFVETFEVALVGVSNPSRSSTNVE